MFKTTLYTAVAGGLLAAATFTTPVIAAPVTPITPGVETNVTDAQHRHNRRHHRRHRHHHHDHYGHHYQSPGFLFFGPRHYHW